MKNVLCIALLSIMLAAPSLLQSQATSGARSTAQALTIEGGERYTLAATRNSHTYQIDVFRVDSTVVPPPANYQLPVIYVLDGNSLFLLVSHIANTIVTFSNTMPAALIVSIGYPADPALSRGANIKNQLSWRTRDLSPRWTSGKPPASGTGGAADFLAFIEQDLKPFVASRYPVNPADQTLVGHSFSGLFAVYTLLNSPRSFTRYVAASPSLFWDEHASITQAQTFAARFGAVQGRLFVCVGDQETRERMGQDMIGDARALVAALPTAKGGLEATFHLFPDENHLSVVPGCLMRGLLEVGALR